MTEVDLARERGIEKQACQFLRGGPIVLAGKPDGKVSPSLAEQLKLLDAISAYATALSKATDPQVMADLEASAATLSDSVTGFATGLPQASTSPIFGPTVKLISTIAVDIVELETRARLRQVIQHMDPFIRTASEKLLVDLDPVEKDMVLSFKVWQRAKACNLRAIRADIQTAKNDLYTNYKEADIIARQFQERITVLDGRDEILLALQQAHFALLSDSVDFKASLQKLKDIVAQLQVLKKAITPTSVKS